MDSSFLDVNFLAKDTAEIIFCAISSSWKRFYDVNKPLESILEVLGVSEDPLSTER
jgi:hypothetical protein